MSIDIIDCIYDCQILPRIILFFWVSTLPVIFFFGPMCILAPKICWTQENAMLVSLAKSSVSLFIPWTMQVYETVPVFYQGQQIPPEKHPKLLGEMFPLLLAAHSTVVQNSHESRRKYWATRLSVRLFARTAYFAHSLARGKVNF